MNIGTLLVLGDLEEDFPQLYGVEIEVEQCTGVRKVRDLVERWSVVEDGSLRNGGREFVSPPTAIDPLVSMIDGFYEAFHKCGWQASARTGVHVHMDMRPRTLDELGAIATLYALLEPALFQIAGAQRDQCIYCVPWYAAPNDALHLGALLNTVSARPDRAAATFSRGVADTCKYSALYFEPLRRFGTIEFRAAPTYTTAAELIYWVQTLTRLVERGKELGTAEKVLIEADRSGVPELVATCLDIPWNQAYEMSLLIEQHDGEGVARLFAPQPAEEAQWAHLS
jgi:hypothetical protein